MCGIAGIWHLDNKPISIEKLRKFTDSLSHRGPDAGCYWLNSENTLGLGHRRLSILDLSVNGNQPMNYANNRYKIIYNGEIFNFLELKKELESKGYLFTTTSDTEVILAAYDCWGNACLNRFNGMWALAILDEHKRTLFLARDRFGIKPLNYIYQAGKLFAFASETYAFKFLEDFSRSFDTRLLSYNIADPFSLEAHGYTIYENIYQVLPGHYMEVSVDMTNTKQKRWWSTLDSMVEVPVRYEEQIEKLRELFFDAVRLRLRSDVPIASALSGGLDSSSVYCAIYEIMNRNSAKERTPDNWQKAFVASFPGTAIDEREYAEAVVNYTNGEAEYIIPDFSNLVQKIKDSTLLFDSIYNTPISVSSDVYMNMNKQRIKVSMDGHGVDEMLFGYAGMVENVLKEKIKVFDNGHDSLLNTVIKMQSKDEEEKIIQRVTAGSTSKRGLTSAIKRIGRTVVPESTQRLLSRTGIVGKNFSLYHSTDLRSLSNDPYETSHLPIELRVPFEAFHTGILPTILRNFDRISMQNSIEIRMPFMDYRVVSYVFSLPFSSKVGDGFSKRILRDAMKGHIPEKVRTRTMKIGFNAPMPEWFSNELSGFILEEINSAAFLQSEIWNGKRIRDFAQKKVKEKSWAWNDCITFWPVFNAHLLISNSK